MSPCPSCGFKGAHVGLFVPRDPNEPAEIIHRCDNESCLVERWNERALNRLDRILADFGRALP